MNRGLPCWPARGCGARHLHRTTLPHLGLVDNRAEGAGRSLPVAASKHRASKSALNSSFHEAAMASHPKARI
jgi:hypothetical protein